MPFLWLAVPTREDRGYLERNSISLLSTAAGDADAASQEWLGRYTVNPAVTRSSLWNVNHVDEPYEQRVLDLLAAYVCDLSVRDLPCEAP